MQRWVNQLISKRGGAAPAASTAVISLTPSVVEQVEKHEKSIALKGDLLQAMKPAVVQAVRKEDDIAKTLLKNPQVMANYAELIFYMMNKNKTSMYKVCVGHRLFTLKNEIKNGI
jgi:hypothetical protein